MSGIKGKSGVYVRTEEHCRLISESHKGLKPNPAQLANLTNFASKNAKWKGDKVGYRALHNWVQNHLGSPLDCAQCGADNLRPRQYHWANISGLYKRVITDWKRMCVKCHIAFDKSRI